jgi:hypothetical protein
MRMTSVIGFSLFAVAIAPFVAGCSGAASSMISSPARSPQSSPRSAIVGQPSVQPDVVNLTKDGGFEMPVVPIGGYDTFTTGQMFSKWTVTGITGNVLVVSGAYTFGSFSYPAATGAQWLDLTGAHSNAATGVAQTIRTTQGATYKLSFAVGNVYDPTGSGGVSSTVNVLVDYSKIFSATNSAGRGQTKLVWRKFSTTFMATSASTRIAFINGDPSNDNINGLDSVILAQQ